MRTDKPGRTGRSDNPDRKGKPGRPVKSGRSERPEKSGRTEKPERAGKPERDSKPERGFRPERAERPAKPERTGRPERSEKFEKPERAGRPERFEKPERGGKPERTERFSKPERGFRTEKYERPGKPERSERYPKTEKSGRPEKAIKLDRSTLPDRTDKPKRVVKRGDKSENSDQMRLNKYIANSGICSRREADRLIEAGAVSINGQIVTELGTKVGPGDKVQYGDQTINREKPRYVLLNKPKGYITTVDDPDDRKTVMALVAGACKERIYPVGRLDRNTTGLLLFTNDGMIAKKLTHPRYGIKKIYHVEIDKSLTRADYLKIEEGFRLEEETVKVDAIEYIGDGKDKKQIGIELHSGQNRIVRRIFEHFDYKVLRLDRVYYAGLTKKNLPRGHWRLLDEQEINLLKMISSKP